MNPGAASSPRWNQPGERIEEAFETVLRFHLEKGYGEIGEEEPGPGKAWLFEGGRRSTPLLQLPYIGKKELIAEGKRARTKEIGDISGPFIETLFRVSCLEGGYVPGVVVKRDLFDCIDLKNAQRKRRRPLLLEEARPGPRNPNPGQL
jgi:hypothetical protein